MKLIRHPVLVDALSSACILTLGNFDGVHLGHQTLLNKLKQLSKQHQLPSVVMSFAPTPSAFFGKLQSSISNFVEKFQLLNSHGVDVFYLLNFNQALANLEAVAFVEKILVKQLNIAHIVVGDDFVFGKNRSGNVKLLRDLGTKYQFEVHQLPSELAADTRISSSNIRQLLEQGNFSQAQSQLGRRFSLSGKVIAGKQQGRTIGFPTLNIALKRQISPLFGVFCVKILLGGVCFLGVANIGIRPTVNGKEALLEVFVFDFDQEVYGQNAVVLFYHKIRDEQKFASFDLLKNQIDQDVQAAKAYFRLDIKNKTLCC